jgi:type VI secretion system protein ImpH
MAAAGGGSRPSLIERLRAAPERFEFARAFRILERLSARRRASNEPARTGDLDADPHEEAAWLRASLTMAYPTAELASLEETGDRPTVDVTLMGLAGPIGALPEYYTQLIIGAMRDKNDAPRDFLDLFNHRALTFFARAAEKYRPPLAFERHGPGPENPIGAVIYALIGLGMGSLQNRQAAPDAALAFYAGHFSHRPRTASALEQVLSDYFEEPVALHQFQGRWAALPPVEQTRVGHPKGYSLLGQNAVAGSRVFDVQGWFRLEVGPLDYAEFLAFLPGGPRLAELAALTRTYVGPALSFDVQLTLKGEEIPPLQLNRSAPIWLGRNGWLPQPAPRPDAKDAVFVLETD